MTSHCHSGARAQAREPGIHNPSAAEYGFRGRSLRECPGMTNRFPEFATVRLH
jgi:hypothetical protein